MQLGRYVKASTENPTGWRPWNSRLEFYIPNTFAVPTAGRGPFLLNAGVCGCTKPSVNGGLGFSQLPNFPGRMPNQTWVRHGGSPTPIYMQPPRAQLSGLGAISTPVIVRTPRQLRQSPYSQLRSTITSSTPSGRTIAAGQGATIFGGGTTRRSRRSQVSTNPTQQPGYVIGADAQGNAIYAQPPANQSVVSYDASGNPVYGAATSSTRRNRRSQQQGSGSSTAGTGGVAQSTTPAGAVITGYDANGNPIYGDASTAAAATTTGTSWFSEDSLGMGLNNGIYLAMGLGLVLILKKK